jgi:membrane-bound lytic murein transglycosylase D
MAAAAGSCAWASEAPPAGVVADARSLLAPAAPEAAPTDPTAPLPPAQGHLGVEMYSMPMSDEDIIGRFVDGFLAGRKDWLQAVLDRSVGYRAVIARAIADKGLPRELMYLPAVESGFQARATSPRGAAGLWQLMRNTASPYGLRMDQWVDERRDFWKSTDASLDKLKDNYRAFDDWYMALAAYNCGVGKLSGIVRRSPGSDYWTLRRKGVLPRETAAFVPQFLALSRILSYPGRYGLALDWDPAPEWERIQLDRCVDLRILSRACGVPVEVLATANPELNFPLTPPASYAYQLKVPAQYVTAVKEALQNATMPLQEFRVHVIVAGDTLSEMAQSYGVSVEMIQEFNPRLSPRALRLGAQVLIPVAPKGAKR